MNLLSMHACDRQAVILEEELANMHVVGWSESKRSKGNFPTKSKMHHIRGMGFQNTHDGLTKIKISIDTVSPYS